MNVVKVKMADVNTAIAPDHLKTTGLGSCIGLVLYDIKHKIAGMAHIMLPSSSMIVNGDVNKAKFADTAIPLLISEMEKQGAHKTNLIAKLAGGAQMFQFKASSDMMRIGPRNIDACKQILKDLSIKVVSEDVGGNVGRTVEFDTISGILHVKTANQGVKEI